LRGRDERGGLSERSATIIIIAYAKAGEYGDFTCTHPFPKLLLGQDLEHLKKIIPHKKAEISAMQAANVDGKYDD
jgi:hypothetical protein